VPLADFSGGLNEDDQPGALQANELRIARNIYWRGKALSSRFGATRRSSSAINGGAPGVGIWQLVRAQATLHDYLAVFGTKLYTNATAAVPTDITGAITITAGQNNLVTFTHFNDLALMVNGVNPPWQWSGSGTATVLAGAPPLFNTMVAKWNRVFGAGDAAAPRTIRYSALGDPTSWPAANTVAAILGDSSSAIEGRDFIWQLDHLGDSAFVGLQNSVGRILYTGDATTPFRYNQVAEFGVEGAHNYVPVGSGGYFLTSRGVHFIRPSDILVTYDSSLISGRRLKTTFDNLNKTRIKYTYGTLYQTRSGNLLVLWPLTSLTGTIHNLVLVMDVTDGPGSERFTVFSGWDANSVGIGRHPSTQREELLFTTTTGYVWQPDDETTSDDGTAYTAEAATRWEDFGVPSEKKNFRDLYLEAKQTGDFDLLIDVYFDYETTPTQVLRQTLAGSGQARWDLAVWDADRWPVSRIVRNYLLGVDDGVVISYRFHTDTADKPWSLYKIVPAVEAVGEAKET
jgi:hypothetical protein